MLRQGSLVQDTLSGNDRGTSAVSLPPVKSLPQWARVNALDKSRYPKPFLKDRYTPLPNPGGLAHTDEEGEDSEGTCEINPYQRIVQLEKSLQFLKQQHELLLNALHEEVERLKRENRELQFALVVKYGHSPPPSAVGKKQPPSRQDSDILRLDRRRSSLLDQEEFRLRSSDSQDPDSDDKAAELRVIVLEEELRSLRKALVQERKRTSYLKQLLEEAESLKKIGAKRPASSERPGLPKASLSTPHLAVPKPNATQVPSPRVEPSTLGPTRRDLSTRVTAQPPPLAPIPPPPRSATQLSPTLPFNASINPLRVQLPGQMPRVPTNSECEAIIKFLQRQSEHQTHEIRRMKADLRDVLYSDKWSPEAFLVAKGYVTEDEVRDANKQERLPRLRQPNKKL